MCVRPPLLNEREYTDARFSIVREVGISPRPDLRPPAGGCARRSALRDRETAHRAAAPSASDLDA